MITRMTECIDEKTGTRDELRARDIGGNRRERRRGFGGGGPEGRSE